MKFIIKVYLLTKSAFNRKFTWFDIGLAHALVAGQLWFDIPTWTRMIANMGRETELPEAFVEWCCSVDEWFTRAFEGGRDDTDSE
jgi:hypothetical protein